MKVLQSILALALLATASSILLFVCGMLLFGVDAVGALRAEYHFYYQILNQG